MHSRISTRAGRREPRFPLQMPILVFGYDRSGRAFMEQAQTLDISIAGARLTGLSSEVAPGFILAVQQGDRRARFQVLWVGQANTDLEGHIGLQCVEVGGHTRKRILCIEANPAEAGFAALLPGDRRLRVRLPRRLAARPWQSFRNRPSICLWWMFSREATSSGISSASCAGIRPAHGSCCSATIRAGFLKSCSTRPTDSSTKPIRAHELLTIVEEMIGAGNQMRWPLARLAARYTLETPVSISASPLRRFHQRARPGVRYQRARLGRGVRHATWPPENLSACAFAYLAMTLI